MVRPIPRDPRAHRELPPAGKVVVRRPAASAPAIRVRMGGHRAVVRVPAGQAEPRAKVARHRAVLAEWAVPVEWVGPAVSAEWAAPAEWLRAAVPAVWAEWGRAAVRAVPVRVAPVRAVPVRVAPVRAAPVRAAPVRAAPVRVAPVRAVPAEWAEWAEWAVVPMGASRLSAM